VEDLYAAYAAKEGPGCLARPVFLDKLADICNRARITCAVVSNRA
jgi:hypothetical protein